MTKKTNSLLLRLGLSTLWKNKELSNRASLELLQQENLIHSILGSKNLNVLKIKKNIKQLNILIFNTQPSIETKTTVTFYYNKYKNFRKTLETSSLSLKSTKEITATKFFDLGLVNNVKINNIAILLYLVLNLYYWKYYIFKKIKILNTQIFDLDVTLFESFNTVVPKVFTTIVVNKKKLRKIRGFLKLKLISLQIEYALYVFTKSFFSVTLTNIFGSKGLISLETFNYKYKKVESRFLYYILLVACVYNNSLLLSSYLADVLKKDKNHFRYIRHFVRVLESLYKSNTIRLGGLQLRITGKLGGKMRRSKYHYKLGKVQLQTLKTNLCYSTVNSFTKFGVLSIKIWLINANNYL